MSRRLNAQRWLKAAADIAQNSDHSSIKVGAVIVDRDGREIAIATNVIVRGVHKREERLKDGQKSKWLACAEQICVATAAANGEKTAGATLYTTMAPCSRCANVIIMAGITSVVIPATLPPKDLKKKWKEAIEIGLQKLKEAGVEIIRVNPRDTVSQSAHSQPVPPGVA